MTSNKIFLVSANYYCHRNHHKNKHSTRWLFIFILNKRLGFIFGFYNFFFLPYKKHWQSRAKSYITLYNIYIFSELLIYLFSLIGLRLHKHYCTLTTKIVLFVSRVPRIGVPYVRTSILYECIQPYTDAKKL